MRKRIKNENKNALKQIDIEHKCSLSEILFVFPVFFRLFLLLFCFPNLFHANKWILHTYLLRSIIVLYRETVRKCWRSMVFIIDGCSFHSAHTWSESGISICWRHLVTSKESSSPIFFRKRPCFNHKCATWNEQPSNLKPWERGPRGHCMCDFSSGN